MGGHRCYIKMCSEDVLQQILEHLSFQDKAQLSLTCKAFLKRHMAGPLEVHLGKQELAQRRSVRMLLHLLQSMSPQQRFKIRELCMYSNSSGIAELPDSQQHRICRALVGNLTVLRLYDVHLRLEALELPGIELRLEVLDLSGSVLEAKGNPRVLKWSLLTSNSPTLRCLILKNVLVHIPGLGGRVGHDTLPFEHVALPRLEELDIVQFGVQSYKPSGNQFFEERRAGACRRYISPLPPQCFKGAPRLNTLRYNPACQLRLNRVAAPNWEHFPNLRSAELHHGPWHYALPFERLPPSLAEFTVWLVPPPGDRLTSESYRVAEYFKHIRKAANAGMRLHKLTLIGFTLYDVCFLATKALGLCLAGIKELVLEPCLSDAAVEALEPSHPVNQLLHVFPDMERLQIRGEPLARLILNVPCLLLEELSLSFCPASIYVNCANLRSLKLAHRFSTGPAQRAAETHEVDMTAWACGRPDTLTVVLGSYREGDVFNVQCKPGTAVSATVSYTAEEWGEWVIGVRLGASESGQSRQRAVRFVCTSSHGLLTWGLA